MTDEPNKPIEVPALTWQVIKWAAGILASGAVATLVILVHHVIGFSGRLSSLERESNTLVKIEQNTEALRVGVEELKRDVAVLKARQP